MGNTEKVASTGRFGSRYGIGIRRKLLKVEPLQFQKHKCPNCGAPRVKRLSKGIFECNKCSHKFVGGSYLPQTLAGGIISKMVSQKVFVPEMVEALAKAAGEEKVPSEGGSAATEGDRPPEEVPSEKPEGGN
ncbi:MAG TPA: 50S ribosomal protein L37ae [Candidatus Diapherotrites archaeon]|uniref:Large ribosomal subunit protein eL43 n=1 Tax=Candidatus Iainarchaeum sp. TaxID=3101447 RepID=A0A7J4IX99_9ARCH|nr:50S ribosomal protein L37ae [Candidatus Diapherotrites archaeon]